MRSTHFAVVVGIIALGAAGCSENEPQGMSTVTAPAGGGGAGGSGGSGGAGGAGGSGGSVGPTGPTAGDCGPTAWAVRFGGSTPEQSLSQERAQGVALDAAGSILVTGRYRGDVDLGGGPLVAGQSNHSLFLAKLAADDASHIWSRGFGDPSGGILYAPSARGYGIAATPDGGVVVVGSFAGVIDLGGGPLYSADEAANPPDVPGGCLFSCQADVLIAKFTGDGEHLWSQRFGDTGGDAATGVAVDAAGNIYVSGLFNGDIDFGGGVLSEAGGFTDAFVAAFDAAGQHLFSHRFGGPHDDATFGVAVDPAGGAVVVGTFRDTADFGAGTLTATGDYDGFVAKLSAGGDLLWANGLGASQHTVLQAVHINGAGEMAIAGFYRGTLDVGGTTHQSAYSDALLLKLAADGSPIWSRSFGGWQNDAATAVACGPDDAIFVAGAASADAVDFGGGALPGGTTDDLFLVELSSAGEHRCSRRYPGQGIGSSSGAHAIAVTASGAVIAGGTLIGTVDFGTGPVASTDALDILLARFE